MRRGMQYQVSAVGYLVQVFRCGRRCRVLNQNLNLNP